MTIRAFAAGAALALLVWAGAGLTAQPDIERHSVYELRIDNGNGGDFEIRLDSDELGFDVFDLAEGESRELSTVDGRPATLTNVEGELWLDVDGRLLQLRSPGGHGMHRRIAHFGDGLTISGGNLDEESKVRIREALRDAGVEQEVFFAEDAGFSWISAGGSHGDHDVDIVMDADGLRHEIVIRGEISGESVD